MNKVFIFLIIFSPLLIHAQECYWSFVRRGMQLDFGNKITSDRLRIFAVIFDLW